MEFPTSLLATQPMLDSQETQVAPTKRPTRSEWLRTGLGNYRWVFILGCPRSGTTFTLNAFAALTDVCATSSGVFPSQMAAIYRNA